MWDTDIDDQVTATIKLQENTAATRENTQSKKEQWAALQQYQVGVISDLNAEYVDLTIQLQEYTTGIQMTRLEILKLTEAYKAIDAGAAEECRGVGRPKRSDYAEAIKAQQEYRRQYEDTFNVDS